MVFEIKIGIIQPFFKNNENPINPPGLKTEFNLIEAINICYVINLQIYTYIVHVSKFIRN